MKSSIILIVLLLLFAYTRAQAPVKASSHGPRDSREHMTLALTGIYTHGDVLYYRLLVINHAAVGYDPGLLRFSIQDRRMVRRHAFQEIDQHAVLVSGSMAPLGPRERRVWMAALRRTVPGRSQCLVIELLERHGGRHLRLRLGWRRILRARVVNDLQLTGG